MLGHPVNVPGPAQKRAMRERADARRDSFVCMVNGDNCELAVILWSD